MTRSYLWLLIAPLLLACAGTLACLGADRNFVSPEHELTAAAEAARVASARFWTGRELPGDWSQPCPIVARPAAHSGGGATSFRFDRSEVSGWSMTVSGRRDRLLADVIPHEVDHMVRASLVRRPIPRWLDEGCATLLESTASHQTYRQRLARHLLAPIDARFLDAAEYPVESAEIDRLYTVGFSLVEFLLERRDAETLLAFQHDPRPPSAKLSEFYDLQPSTLDSQWRTWLTERVLHGDDCTQVNCPWHRSHRTGKPPLTVFTSEWCVPCRTFWSDFAADGPFRAALEARYRLVRIDVDRQPLLARAQQIDSVPVFVAGDRRTVGYEGPEWLLERLQLTRAATSDTTTTPLTSSPPAAKPAIAPAMPTSPPLTATLPTPAPVATAPVAERPGLLARTAGLALGIAPRLWPWLELAGVVSGSAATGGVGALALAALLRLVRRRRARRAAKSVVTPAAKPAAEGGAAPRPAPFPRQLDEARELLELRQSEGRVAVLDALRGMFLDDELEKTLAAAPPSEAAALTRLRTAIDTRVSQAAPLSVTLTE